MSSVAAPYGMLPVNLIGGQGFAGATTQYKIASGYGTSIFTGDVVKLVAAGTVEKDAGTNAATPIGVFMGCFYTDADGPKYRPYWPASTVASDAVAYVFDDPDGVFMIQADGTIAQAALGANFALVQTAGSTYIGKSKNALANGAGATTNTLPLRIVGFVNGADSAVGDAYTDVLVKWNAGLQMTSTTGT